MLSEESAIASYRAAGKKITAQRMSVIRALVGNTGHPSAEAIYDRASKEIPSLSLKTVYATLHELSDLRMIEALDLGTGSMRFDPNLGHHHHLVCEECGKTRDIDIDTSQLQLTGKKRQGFAVSSTEIIFRGTCEVCRENKAS